MSDFMNMNQFAQTPIKGDIALGQSPNTISAQIDPNSVATLVPGDYVKLIPDVVGNTVIVDKCLITDTSIGVVIFTPKKDLFVAGDLVEITLAFGIMFMEAGSGTIDRGDQLEFVPTGTKVITNAGNPVCGIALDESVNTGDIIRVLILDPYVIPATITSGSINGVAIGGSTPAAGTFTTLLSTVSGAAGANTIITPGATPAVDATLGSNFTLTPGEDETISTTGAIVGQIVAILVTTSGVTSRTLTFGSGFTTTGTLATGTSSGKKFLIVFRCFVAGALVEASRTTAM